MAEDVVQELVAALVPGPDVAQVQVQVLAVALVGPDGVRAGPDGVLAPERVLGDGLVQPGDVLVLLPGEPSN